jgi:cytochrome c-type biogenesis protein CcmF
MNYIGEHLWAAELGRGLTAFSFAFALLSAIAYYQKGTQWKTLGRLAFRIHATTLFGLIGTLFFIMANHYFEFDYVWKHTSLDLEPALSIFCILGGTGRLVLIMDVLECHFRLDLNLQC